MREPHDGAATKILADIEVRRPLNAEDTTVTTTSGAGPPSGHGIRAKLSAPPGPAASKIRAPFTVAGSTGGPVAPVLRGGSTGFVETL
mgnify:CR=1 FL=1